MHFSFPMTAASVWFLFVYALNLCLTNCKFMDSAVATIYGYYGVGVKIKFIIVNFLHINTQLRIVTSYRLDVRDSIPCRGRDCSHDHHFQICSRGNQRVSRTVYRGLKLTAQLHLQPEFTKLQISAFRHVITVQCFFERKDEVAFITFKLLVCEIWYYCA
jgi:hypothetical protein